MLKRTANSSVIAIAIGLLMSGLAGCEQDQGVLADRANYNPTFVPSADEVIEKMFEMAKVRKEDLVFDLGAGDGRILFMAAKKFGCRGIGLELNPIRIREAMDQAEKYKVGNLVEIRHADALKVKDLKDATVVVLYMHPEFMDDWFPIAKNTLRPGTRIVAHDYTWTDKVNAWEPTATATVQSTYRNNHKVFLWIVPKENPS